jgi:hypothetical protein
LFAGDGWWASRAPCLAGWVQLEFVKAWSLDECFHLW